MIAKALGMDSDDKKEASSSGRSRLLKRWSEAEDTTGGKRKWNWHKMHHGSMTPPTDPDTTSEVKAVVLPSLSPPPSAS